MQQSSTIEQTVDHLFRHEWGKLVAALTKVFGVHNLQLAEDVVQDTLLKALDNWKINGLPANPSAWLFTAARNKAVDVIRKQKQGEAYAKSVSHLLQSEYTLAPTVNELVNDKTIDDDRLRMMFVCCHPSLPTEAQVALILRILCGFSVTEIAKAFVSNYDTIEKRLYRAKQTFRENKIEFELPPSSELNNRVENVLMAIYLLFNEGYNSTNHEDLIRNDLMNEAMRLCELVCRSPSVQHANAHALMALMCFTSSRNAARMDEEGNVLLLKQQDRRKWNRALIETGVYHLEESAAGETISKYHIEAGIAYEHAQARDYDHTNWHNILNCYNLLYQLYPSPVIALNRAIVVSELKGATEGIKAIEAIHGLETLKNYYLLPATLGELYWRLKEYDKAREYFEEAIELTQSAIEKKLLQGKLSKTERE
ncbi:sigma-70 family RNA polymerase sigma factor [Lacibacter sp. H375]|uniref:RNA polymerase sigma factor n=1 Tax=Lacibacter sp. H375 TaxID=3133424 RepID=UPI0030C210FE